MLFSHQHPELRNEFAGDKKPEGDNLINIKRIWLPVLNPKCQTDWGQPVHMEGSTLWTYAIACRTYQPSINSRSKTQSTVKYPKK